MIRSLPLLDVVAAAESVLARMRQALAGHDLGRVVFISGAGLSLVAIAGIALGVYFAGSAPHLPASATALETLAPPGDSWPPPVKAMVIETRPARTNVASAAPVLPSAGDPPPIDASELPPLNR
jgi:hypothetical protein